MSATCLPWPRVPLAAPRPSHPTRSRAGAPPSQALKLATTGAGMAQSPCSTTHPRRRARRRSRSRDGRLAERARPPRTGAPVDRAFGRPILIQQARRSHRARPTTCSNSPAAPTTGPSNPQPLKHPAALTLPARLARPRASPPPKPPTPTVPRSVRHRVAGVRLYSPVSPPPRIPCPYTAVSGVQGFPPRGWWALRLRVRETGVPLAIWGLCGPACLGAGGLCCRAVRARRDSPGWAAGVGVAVAYWAARSWGAGSPGCVPSFHAATDKALAPVSCCTRHVRHLLPAVLPSNGDSDRGAARGRAGWHREPASTCTELGERSATLPLEPVRCISRGTEGFLSRAGAHGCPRGLGEGRWEEGNAGRRTRHLGFSKRWLAWRAGQGRALCL